MVDRFDNLSLDMRALQRARSRDWRLPFVIILTILLAYFFWSGSRYPALSEKALMGGETPLSGLSFDIVIEIVPGASLISTLWAHTVNWIFTNLKGMTFGVLFGAMALTLLSLLQKRSFKSGFANSALGAIIGAPLGVCVNCAAPIALGLHAGRLRLETTLSAMIASPTLNVIVVTMSFALLPVHVAAVKLFASLMMVLVAVPLLCRFVLKSETDATRNASAVGAIDQKLDGLSGWVMRKLAPAEFDAGEYGTLATITWFARTYGRNLLFIFIVTVPLMILAAVLGAFFVEFFSTTTLAQVLPWGSWTMLLLGLVLVAMVMSFAPAPIALDIILTAVILSLGVHEIYGAAIVIALGSFSVYAFIIIWKAISPRTAISLWLTVVAASVCAGILTFKLTPAIYNYQIDSYRSILAGSEPPAWPEATDTETQVPLGELQSRIDAQSVASEAVRFTQSGAQISSIELRSLTAPSAIVGNDDPIFSRVIGSDIGIGITEPLHSLSRSFFHLFEGGVAAGDIHGDGWADVALRKSFLSGGVALYANIGGEFVRQEADLGPVDDAIVITPAFADLDADGALDLVVTTERSGNYVFWNRGGGFDVENSLKLPGDDRAITQSLAFADFDRDGALDIVLGNAGASVSAPSFGSSYAEVQRNILLLNQGERIFESREIESHPGQTLTLLASDIDGNGTIDLVSGDDVARTDEVQLFADDGSFTTARGDLFPFPYRLNTTMSYDEGDYNNDLIPDYYGGQIAMVRMVSSAAERAVNIGRLCEQIGADLNESAERVEECISTLNAISQLRGAYQGGLQSGCDRIRNSTYQQQCAARALTRFYYRTRTDEPDQTRYDQCREDLATKPRLVQMCDTLLIRLQDQPSHDQLDAETAPTHTENNILLTGSSTGEFSEDAAALNVAKPGWTWDARFTDLDQDGWQDLYILNGYWARAPEGDLNRLYRNDNGIFYDASMAFGLSDSIPSLSAARFDFDRDGDVDLIRSLSGPNIILHRNDRPAGKALWVHLRQAGGNTMAIGARVTICVDGETQVRPGKCQVRPIKASGGFQSFDPIVAHFGLGSARNISLISVLWPDGSQSVVRPDDLDSGEIVITRAMGN